MKRLLFIAAFVALGLGLNATDNEIVVSGYTTNNSGDAVSGTTVTCLETSVSSKPSDIEGFYSVVVPSGSKVH